MATLAEITTEADFESRVSGLSAKTPLIIYFHTPWAAPCTQMSTILTTLASSYPAPSPTTPDAPIFLSLNAEELPDVSERYEVTAVPFLALQKGGKVVETVSGSDAARVRTAIERHAGVSTASKASSATQLPPPQSVTAPSAPAPATTAATDGSSTISTSKEDLVARLSSLVRAAPVMLFMKGTPSAPQCGFSRQLVALLRGRGVRYGFFNILADDEVRQGLKTFADWPTFPQLWANGELVGGLDIVKEEFDNDAAFLLKFVATKPSVASGAPGAAAAP
ncbi:MAG: monothiol glutaredoxin grx4 [Thelocarpon impressellum]|nr:MAG: monothiol glutaredoxin grx4 [Thelocarpon impressellum]